MVDEISDRVGAWLPDDITDRDEIKQAIRESGYNNNWDESTKRTIVDKINAQRDLDTPDELATKREQQDVFGGQESRYTAVRDDEGKIVGKADDTITWTDRWGNVMAKKDGADMSNATKIGEIDDS